MGFGNSADVAEGSQSWGTSRAVGVASGAPEHFNGAKAARSCPCILDAGMTSPMQAVVQLRMPCAHYTDDSTFSVAGITVAESSHDSGENYVSHTRHISAALRLR